jgi:hypothetical protein
MLNLNGRWVRYADRFCCVGILFQSTERNIFVANYIEKADIARGTGYSVLGTEAYIGNLPPKEGRLLYMACIDPYLISGAGVIVDVTQCLRSWAGNLCHTCTAIHRVGADTTPLSMPDNCVEISAIPSRAFP